MMSYKQYLSEMSYPEFEELLKNIGYPDLKPQKGARSKIAVILTDKNRVDVLKDVAAKIPGGKYDATVTGSTVGATILPGGYKVLAKPIKGGGSGAGADATRLTESAQCLYCAAQWYQGGKFDSESLKAAAQKIDTDEKLDNMLENLSEDWVDASIKIAQLLHKNFGDKRYTFHRGSTWVGKLENQFKKINRIEKEFSNLNKWTPADIYLVSDVGSKETFTDCDSFVELNARMLKHLHNKDIIGVSLKKVDTPTMKYVNDSDDKSTYHVKNPYYTLGLKDFFASKDVYAYYQEGAIQFRGFNQIDFQGEIKGKFASHGKVGGGVIKNIIRKITKNDIYMASEVAKKYRNEKSKEVLIKEFYGYYSYLQTNPMNFDAFAAKARTMEMGWFISKMIGCQMLYYIDKSKKLDAIIGAIIDYAASQSDLSCPFVKVS